jgi:hypothetical protein
MRLSILFQSICLGSLLCLPSRAAIQASPRAPEQIQAEMTQIRLTTNWEDPEAVRKANARLQELLKESMAARSKSGGTPATGKASSVPDQQVPGTTDEARSGFTIVSAMLDAAAAGKSGYALVSERMAKQIRDQVDEDMDPSFRNQILAQQLNTLIVDFSTPEGKTLAEQLGNYKAIENLVLTGGSSGAPVNLVDVLGRCGQMPLRTLSIINFRSYVKTLPANLVAFRNLSVLALFNNQLAALPPSLMSLVNLRVLYLDSNPIPTLLPGIQSLAGLQELGVGRTGLSKAELDRLPNLLPNCKVKTQ